MRLVILDDCDKASDWAARYVKKRIHEFKPGPDKYFTLGLPTGTDGCHRKGWGEFHLINSNSINFF